MNSNVLYITFDGLLDIIPYSQVIPYLEGFAANGYQIYVLSYEKEGGEERTQRILEMRCRLESMGMQWTYFAHRKRPYMLAHLLNLLQGFIKIFVLVCRQKISVIHARGFRPGVLAFIFKRLLGIRFLFDMRGFWVDEKVDGGRWKKDSTLYCLIKSIERRLVSHADRIVVLSHRARELLPELVGCERIDLPPVDVIPCCVDVERFAGVSQDDFDFRKRELGFPEDAVVVTYVGSIGTWYKFEEALDFFKVWRGCREEIRLLVITPSHHDEILEILRKKNINDGDCRVISVAPESVPSYLAMVHVGLVFLAMTFSKEASSAVRVSEYLASGLPMVVSDKAGDIPALVEKEGIGVVINQYSNDEYARAIEHLESLLPNVQFYRTKCQAIARESYSHEIGLRKYLRIYKELIPVR